MMIHVAMIRTAALLVVCAAVLGACQSTREPARSRELWEQGRYEEAVRTLADALAHRPGDEALKVALERTRERALSQLTIAAERTRDAGQYGQARELLQSALRIDPDYPRAKEVKAEVDLRERQAAELAAAKKLAEGGDPAGAQLKLRRILAEDPNSSAARRLLQELGKAQRERDLAPRTLRTVLIRPITLDLRETPLRNVFDALAQTAGLNFVFDHDVKLDSRTSIYIRNSSIEDVLRLVLTTNSLERKVLNDNTILIYPGGGGKAREYQDLVLRTFYLVNADTKQTVSLLKSMAHVKEVYSDERLNMVTIRDTPEVVRVAERLVESIDVAEPEVMLEVEVMEISRSRAEKLGLQFPTQVTRGLLSGTSLTTGQIGQTVTSLPNPLLIANIFLQDKDANLLASPRIRVRNREKAKVLIGEKLPVVTSTAVQNAGVSSSVSYIDIGLKLEVEPQVYLDDEVGIKVNLEVNSNLGAVAADNTTAYDVGTRSAATTLRLHDGETQVLAGLLSDNDQSTQTKLPGLGSLPWLGRLFTYDDASHDKTEIVLLITPRIIRNLQMPEFDALLMAAGTESDVGAAPLLIGATPAHAVAVAPAAGGAAPAPAPAAAAEAEPATGTPPAPPAAAALAGPADLSMVLQAPVQASLGSDFAVSIQVNGAAGAAEGEVVIGFDTSLLQAAGPSAGRAVVHLSQVGAGTLSGSATFHSLAAGAGSVHLSTVEGSVRMQDGTRRALPAANADIKIGL